MKEIADDAVAQAPSVEHVLVCSRMGRDDTPWMPGRDVRWDELLDPQPARFETRELDPEHPLFIAYTSGTTGRPKGAVHVHGGFLVKIAEEVAYQTDVHPGEILYWFADLGWIMGPWEVVGATALGATVFLSDTAPDHPGPDRLWGMVERHGITHIGVSPTLIRADPARRGRRVGTTARACGSWPRPASRGTRSHGVGSSRSSARAGARAINLSGGTEVGACFLSPHPIAPLKPCTLEARRWAWTSRSST